MKACVPLYRLQDDVQLIPLSVISSRSGLSVSVSDRRPFAQVSGLRVFRRLPASLSLNEVMVSC